MWQEIERIGHDSGSVYWAADSIRMSDNQLVALFFLQVSVILLACRVVGWVA